MTKIYYLCDRRGCEFSPNCPNNPLVTECTHTADITHALHYNNVPTLEELENANRFEKYELERGSICLYYEVSKHD